MSQRAGRARQVMQPNPRNQAQLERPDLDRMVDDVDPVRRLLKRFSQCVQTNPQQPPARSAGGGKMSVRIRIALKYFKDAWQRSQ